MDWWRDIPGVRTVGKVVAAIWSFYTVDYIMRECGWKLHAQSDDCVQTTCGENFVFPTTLYRKQADTARIVKKIFTQFLACKKISKSSNCSLNLQNFVTLTTLSSRTMSNIQLYTCYTHKLRVMEMSLWTLSYVGQSIRKKPRDEIGSPWLRYARKIQERSVQDEATQRLWKSTQSWKRSMRNLN